MNDDIKLPLTLCGIALAIYVGFGLYAAGGRGAVNMVFFFLLQAAITAVLGVVACYLVAMLFGTSLGTPKSAFVKLAAVAVFPSAVGLVLLQMGTLILAGLTTIVLYFVLLKLLFDLEMLELILLVIALWLVEYGAEKLIDAIQGS